MERIQFELTENIQQIHSVFMLYFFHVLWCWCSQQRGLPAPRRWGLPTMLASFSQAATPVPPQGWSRCRGERWLWLKSPPACRRTSETDRTQWPDWWQGWQRRWPIPTNRAKNSRDEQNRKRTLWELREVTNCDNGFQPFPHQTICCAPFMLLCDVCHVRKDHREGDGKNTRHGDDCKVPPEKKQ